MSTRKNVPLPDVLRFLRRAREGGPYARVSQASRSALERYMTLYRALEHLARFSAAEPTELTITELRAKRLQDPHPMIRELGKSLTGLTPMTLGSLLGEDITGASRDGAIRAIQSDAKVLARGQFSGSAPDCRLVERLLRSLRNAAVHAKLMTSDHDIEAAFVAGSKLLDGIIVSAYQQAFDMDDEELAGLLDGNTVSP